MLRAWNLGVVSLWFSIAAHPAILLTLAPKDYLLIVGTDVRVTAQPCGSFQPRLSDADMALKACREKSGKPSYESSREDFEQSFQALHGVPTSSTKTPSIFEIFLAAERGTRSAEGDEPTSETLQRVTAGYLGYLGALDEGERIVPLADEGTRNALLYSFQPVYSDGNLIFRFSEKMKRSEITSHCDGSWFRASLANLGSISDKQNFIEWMAKRKRVKHLSVWAWQRSLRREDVEKSEAYAEVREFFQVELSDLFATAEFSSLLNAESLGVDLSQFPRGLLYAIPPEDSRAMPSVCFRAFYPDFLDIPEDPVTEERFSLEILAGMYGMKPSDLAFDLTQIPEVHKIVGLKLFNKYPLFTGSEYQKLQVALTSYIKAALPRREKLLAIVAEQKTREAAKRAEEARIAREKAESDARWNAKLAQMAAERQQRQTLSGGFTLDGRKWRDAKEYERATGWRWNADTGFFEGPVETSRDGGRTWFKEGGSRRR